MWLYVPTSCRSAPEPEGSTSASDWRARMLARSVTWNGKHSPPQTWSQRLKQVSWTRLLFGAILAPSTASRGVERWIGSLAESRASRTAPPGNVLGPVTNGTSGPTLPGSLERSGPASSSWKTFQESQGITTSASGQSYEEWITGLRRDYSRRLRLVRHMSGNGSLSWATPMERNWHPTGVKQAWDWDGGRYRREDGSLVETNLPHQTTHWPTPTSRDEKDRGHTQEDRPNRGPTLGRDVLNWPTPTTAPNAPNTNTNTKNGPASLGKAAQGMWATPNVPSGARMAGHAERKGRTYTSAEGKKVQVGLEWETRLWPTATVSTGAYACGKGNPETPILKLDGAARIFPTPTASDSKGFDGPNKTSPSKDYSRLPRMTSTPGHDCSPKCRRLNPLFVERLMGWPGGWTLLPSGRTGSGSLATEWSRWWRLMRSALSRLERG